MKCIGILLFLSQLLLPSFGLLSNDHHLRRLQDSFDKIKSIDSNYLALFYRPDDSDDNQVLNIHGLWPNIKGNKNHPEYTCCCDDYITRSTYDMYKLGESFACKPTTVDKGAISGKSAEEKRKHSLHCRIPDENSDEIKQIAADLGKLWPPSASDPTPAQFWVKEYIKHGSCGNMIFENYFSKVKALFKNRIKTIQVPLENNPNAFTLAGLRKHKVSRVASGQEKKDIISLFENKKYYKVEVSDAFIKDMKKFDLKFIFKCQSDVKTNTINNGKKFLSEVLLCFATDLESDTHIPKCSALQPKPIDPSQDCFENTHGFYI